MNHDVNRVSRRTLDALQIDFQRIRHMGCQVVRMWAFNQGQGIRWNQTGDTWTVQGIDRDFQDNVREITRRAAAERIKIYWTLFNGADFIDDADDDPARRMKSAFQSILTEPAGGRGRRPVMNSLLPAFMTAINAHPDGVFGIDLMNEPDVLWPESIAADMRDLHGLHDVAAMLLRLWLDSAPVDSRHYVSFFRECSQAIRGDLELERRTPISVGFCRFNSMRNLMPDLEPHLDFYDYHHYNHLDVSDTGILPLPRWDTLHSRKPCLFGEFGLSGTFQQDYRGLQFTQAYRRSAAQPGTPVPVAELFEAQADCVANVMNAAYERGYAGCLIWEYGKQYTNTRNAWSPYNPRALSDATDWGDRFFITWTPDPAMHVPARFDRPFNPTDRRLIGRPALEEIYDIYMQHRAAGRCPPP